MNTNTKLSHSRIWAIAGPMMLANISTPLLGLVDTAVVGHLGSAVYLGAVAIGTTIFSFLFWGFGFLRMVTTGLTAQAITKESNEAVLIQSALLAICIAFILLTLQIPIAYLAFTLIDTSTAVATEADKYFDTRIWSAPATLLNYVLMGWLIGRESARAALSLALIINITNILLDLLFVNYFEMKTQGVALATVIAEYIGVLTGWILIRQAGLNFHHHSVKSSLIQLYKNRASLALHLNFMVRTLCLIFSFAFFTQQGAKQGDIVLAANMVLLNFITLMAYVLDAFANVTEIYTGKAIGQKNVDLMKSSLLMSGGWAIFVAIGFSGFYWMMGPTIIHMLTSIEIVAETAQRYLFWLILAPVIGVWSYIFDGLFVGATLGRQMRNTMLISVFICYLPAWYLLQSWGNDGLWLALLSFLAARALSQSCYLNKIFRLASNN